MCAPRFKPGPPSEEAQVLSDRLASTITACGIMFDNPPIPDKVTLTAQAFSPSQRYAYTPGALHGYYTSMQHASIMTATRSTLHSLRWSPHSKTVRIPNTRVSRVPFSNCRFWFPKMTATLPKATYNEETGHTRCTRKVRVPLPLKRLPISYSFGVFDGYDSAHVSSSEG